MFLLSLLSNIKTRLTSDWRQIDWQRTGLLIGLILAAAAALWQFAMPTVRTITTTRFMRVPEIHKVESVKRVYVACPEKGIITLDRAEIAKKLNIDFLQGGNLAAANQNQPPQPPLTGGSLAPSLVKGRAGEGLEVTATATLPESDNGIDVVSVMNMETGESQLVAREKSAPWFQFRNDGAMGIRYGINQRLEYVGNVYGRWDFLRVKDIYLSANGDLSTGADAKIQLGAEYRW